VVAILAIVAGGLVASMGGVRAPAQRDLARHEMAQVREALLRFEADTGYLPGEGPFDLAGRGVGAVSASRIEELGVPALQVEEWADSAANLWQLVLNPLPDHPLASWDPDRRRGWRGPYLSMGSEGQVRAGFLDRRIAPGVDADAALHGVALSGVPAVADPFVHPCGEAGQLSWAPFPAGADLEQQGSPYLLIVPSDRQQARLICLGENHQLEPQGSGDDLVLYLYR